MSLDNFCKKKALKKPLTLITAYDAWSAKLCESVGFDALLVGDSVAMTVHGFSNTVNATLEMMAFHVESAARGAPKSFIIGDLPFMSYRKGLEKAAKAAEILMRKGAQAVKLEGCLGNEDIVRHLVQSGIPVMGHLGLTPQHVFAMGGYKVQGRTQKAAETIFEQAQKLQDLGCFSIVLECVPSSLAKKITEELKIPVIGIGAGQDTDGQILVFHDVLGLHSEELKFKFVRQYVKGATVLREGLVKFREDIDLRKFPKPEEGYSS